MAEWTQDHDLVEHRLKNPGVQFTESFEQVLDRIADFNAKTPGEGKTLMAVAAMLPPEEALIPMIQRGGDIRSITSQGRTLLHHAGNAESARYLIRQGLEVDAADGEGRTPLHGACLHGKEQMARVLLHAGADVRRADQKKKQPIHCLAESDNLLHKKEGLLAALREHGADLDARSSGGLTPVHLAVVRVSPLFVLNLCASGASIDLEDDRGCRPIHYASRDERAHAFRVLLGLGASSRGVLPHKTAMEKMLQENALIHCVKSDSIDVLRLHLERNPAIDPIGLKAARAWLKTHSNPAIESLLLSHHARQEAVLAMAVILPDAHATTAPSANRPR